MMKINDLIENADEVFTGKGATLDQIKKAETDLGLGFAKDYVDYLSRYGSIMINGHELTGISKAEQDNVVKVTKNEKGYYDFIPATAYVVEDTQTDGIVIWQDASGALYKSTPDGDFTKFADSLVDYLKKFV
jgi:hypothetical protein